MAGNGHGGAKDAPAPPAVSVTIPGKTVPLHAPVVQKRKLESDGDTTDGHAPDEIASLASPRILAQNPFSRKNTSLDIDDYFVRTRLARPGALESWSPQSCCLLLVVC